MTGSRLRALWVASRRAAPAEPIRAELFSVERLEQHAESLAEAQPVTPRPGGDRRLARRLRDNGRVLLQAYRDIAAAIKDEQAITPAAEWLVDNFHVVEEQIREIRDDLPRGYYRQLPKLAQGPLRGYPRVFGLAWAYVAHTDSRFDPQTLCRFVRAYQRVQPLTIGELWAVAITLRIVLVENLRRSAERITSSRAARQEADALADRLLGEESREAELAGAALRGLEQHSLPREFAVQLIQRLRDHDPSVTPALRWLDERLGAQATTADELVREEHQRQAAMNVTVRNVITSMRLVSAVDWAELFESVSLVDAALCAESDFGEMDFATRDRYRHAIEQLARGAKQTELEIARRALQAARRAAAEPEPGSDPDDRRRQDPGYFLIAGGRQAFERELRFRVPLKTRILRADLAAGTPGYLGTIAVLSALILALPVYALARSGVDGATLLLLGLLALIPASDAALALVNRGVTRRFGPKPMPGLELRDGVPPSLRTMVVVPTLLTTRAEIEQQLERLEVHALSSPDADLRFALLSDWTDSATESAPGDDELLAAAVEGIARLNHSHEGPRGRRALPAAPPPAGLERVARASGWAGSASAASSSELNRWLRGGADTPLPPGRRSAAHPAGGRALRPHARRRHPPAARGRAAAGREAGPSAEPPAARSEVRPRRRRVRRAPAARHAVASDRARRLALPARLLGPGRHGPLRLRRLRRLPGLLRRGLLQRQGHLRRRRLRGRPRRADPGERAAESRPAGGPLRAGRAGVGHRALRGVSVALRGRGGPAASLGARRLAAAALDPRPALAERAPRSRRSGAGR